MQQALLGSARTGDEGKHDVLTRVVANRLDADAESIRALATRIAVEAIPVLISHQVQYLGLAAVAHRIRPLWWDSRDVLEQVAETEQQLAESG